MNDTFSKEQLDKMFYIQNDVYRYSKGCIIYPIHDKLVPCYYSHGYVSSMTTTSSESTTLLWYIGKRNTIKTLEIKGVNRRAFFRKLRNLGDVTDTHKELLWLLRDH